MAAGDVLVPVGREGAADEGAQQETRDGKCNTQSGHAVGHDLEGFRGEDAHVVAQQGEFDDGRCNRPDESTPGEDLPRKGI